MLEGASGKGVHSRLLKLLACPDAGEALTASIVKSSALPARWSRIDKLKCARLRGCWTTEIE